MALVTTPLLASFEGGRVTATLRYDDQTLLCDRLICVVPDGLMTITVLNKQTGQLVGPFSITQNTTRNINANLDIRRDNLGRSPAAFLSVQVGWAA
jgi:hypothetical protein